MSIRYTSYTNAQAIATTDIPGKDIALMAVQVVCPAIAAAANAIVFTLKGAGTIKAIMNAFILKNNGNIRLEDPTGFNRGLNITLSADSRSVIFTLPANAQVIENTDTAYLLLAVGY